MAHPKRNIVQTSEYYPVSRIALTMGTVGAIVGGSSSAAKNFKKVNNNEINRETAVKEIFKESAGLGVAMGAATAVIKTIVPQSSILGIVGIFAVATGTKMIWDSTIGEKTNSTQKESKADEKNSAHKEPAADKETEKSTKTEKKATK